MDENIYSFDKNGFPLIKVLMRTYGEHKSLTEEAIYSFLKQDYPNKRLIILNTHKNPLKLEELYKNITVINKPNGLENTALKTKHLLEQVETGLFCILDDDDLLLPYHLSILHKVWEKNKNDGLLRVATNGYIFYNVHENNVTLENGQPWVCFLYDIQDGTRFRELIMPMEKYPFSSGQDVLFTSLITKEFKTIKDTTLFPSYIYRWGTGSMHLSGHGKLLHSDYKKYTDKVNSKNITDNFRPFWKKDYVSIFEEFVASDKIYGGMGISKDEWKFMKSFLKTNKIDSVAEFGSGISTVLFAVNNIHVLSFETNNDLIQKNKYLQNIAFSKWDGMNVLFIPPEYSTAFIDGPFGGSNREFSYKSVSLANNIEYVICHDMHRKEDRDWVLKYIEPKFALHSTDNSKIRIYKRRKTMNEKLISVIMPVGISEKEEYFVNTIKSLNEMSKTKSIEIVFLADSFPEEKMKCLSQFDNIKVYRTDKNVGERVLFNKGVEIASGKYIFRLDAHCRLTEDWDEKLINACGNKTGVVCSLDALSEDWQWKGHDYKFVYIRPDGEEKWWGGYHGEDKNKEVQPTMCLTGCGFFTTRDYYMEHLRLDESLAKWGALGPELALRIEASDGTLLLHKGVKCGHLFNTNKNGYPVSNLKDTRNKLANRYRKELNSLAIKFKPVPSWNYDTMSINANNKPVSSSVKNVTRRDKTEYKNAEGKVVKMVLKTYKPVVYLGNEDVDNTELGKKITENAEVCSIRIAELINGKWEYKTIEGKDNITLWLFENEQKE